VNVERANANGILGAIKTTMERLHVSAWSNKLIGMGSDGAAVMLGKDNGVIAKLKELQPVVQAVHCSAHRIELAYKDALRKIPIHGQVEGIMSGIFCFYKKSPLNRQMLLQSYCALNQSPVVPTRVGGTRWITHTRIALGNLLRGYEAITTHLSQVKDNSATSADQRGKAKNYLSHLQKKDTVLYLHHLMDVAETLSTLSVAQQKTDATVSDIHDTLQVTIKLLQKYEKR
jgi:hypothetical protein